MQNHKMDTADFKNKTANESNYDKTTWISNTCDDQQDFVEKE